jgi:hypothetical protein
MQAGKHQRKFNNQASKRKSAPLEIGFWTFRPARDKPGLVDDIIGLINIPGDICTKIPNSL